MELSKRLKILREKRRLSINDMARALHISANTYREWELGRAILKSERIYPKLAEIFGVSLYYLLTGQESHAHLWDQKLDEMEKILRELREIARPSSI